MNPSDPGPGLPNRSPLPSRFLLFLTLGAFLTEVVLLARNGDGVLRQGLLLATAAIAILVWLWFTAGWLLWAGAAGAHGLTKSWPKVPRAAVLLLLAVVLDAAVVLYLTSWGLQLRTGSFASLEAIRYAFFDYRGMTWFYVSQSEPASLVALGILVAGVSIALPVLLIRSVRAGGPAWRSHSRSLLFWLASGAVALLLLRPVQQDRSEMRRASRIEALKSGLNPWIAMAASWRDATEEERIEPVLDPRRLHPIDRSWRPPAGGARPPVIFVKIESIRADVLHKVHQGVEIAPNLNALAGLGVDLNRAYSMSTHTDYSDVSTLSSLYPLRKRRHHYYKESDPWPKVLIYDVLKQAGYSTALVAAENLRWGKMDAFLVTPNLDFFFDTQRSGGLGRVDRADDGIAREVREGVLSSGVIEDKVVTDVALNWMKSSLAAKRPFFLNLDLQSAHFPYRVPADVPRPFQPSTIDFDVSFVRYPYKKTEVLRNAYFNALHEADRQLGRLVSALRAAGVFEGTILVVYGDHGEAFREGGVITHAGRPVEVVARVPCVIVAPRFLKPRKDDYPAELIDVVPTVLGLLGWPPHPNFQGIDLFAADRLPTERRALFLHTENPLSHTDAVVVGGRWKYVLDRHGGTDRLYDLEKDPGEERDVRTREPAVTARLGRLLREWRRRQLAYYSFPAYFENYYPPPPPEVATR